MDRRKPEKITICGIIGHRPLRGRCPKGGQEKRKRERMNWWKCEWINEWMYRFMNAWMKKHIGETRRVAFYTRLLILSWMNEKNWRKMSSDRNNHFEWMNEWKNVWVNKWTDERMNKRNKRVKKTGSPRTMMHAVRSSGMMQVLCSSQTICFCKEARSSN